jgi:hypothetical protein
MTTTETGRDDDSHRDIAFTRPVKPTPEHPSRGFLLLIAAVLAAAGIEIGYDAFVHSPRLRDPSTIGYLVALIFLSGAARLLEIASGRRGKGTWVAFIFFGAFGVIAWWIALASPPGNCSSSLNGLSIIGGEAVCKFGFGVFAAFSTLMFCVLLSRAFRGKGSYY